MPRRDREPSDVMVTPLDLTDVCEGAARFINARRAFALKDAAVGGQDVTCDTGPDWAVCDTPAGLYALCTEGVGPSDPITDDDPLDVEFFEHGDGWFAIVPTSHLKMGPDDLRQRMKPEPVPLHVFIRSFGSRLEANYSMWRRTLEGALKVHA